ncbi:MAG TPA: hypothetical protein PLQ95_03370 [Thiobacillus sp.]|nr:hypothetical protein [Thiobacillus sp.]
MQAIIQSARLVFALLHASAPAQQAQVFASRCPASQWPEKAPPAIKIGAIKKLFSGALRFYHAACNASTGAGFWIFVRF